MWRTVRRVDVAESWKRAKQAYAAVVSENALLKDENEQLRAELAEARAVNREMRANICARYEAWDELVTLYRERQLELARRTERTLETTLH